MQFFSLLASSGADKWYTGGMTTLLGLGMTFVMLALLICAIHLLRLILKGLEKYLPVVKEKIASFFKKKSTDSGITSAEPELNSQSMDAEIDQDTMLVIEQSVKNYVASTADDGKPHDRIKIISVKEVTND